MRLKRFLVGIMGMLLVSPSIVMAEEGAEPAQNDEVVFVELFTAQGCGECPPADDFLTKLVARDDVIGLSYHVTSWDYIGWVDLFADNDFTKRHQQYAVSLKDKEPYAPQMVVDGYTAANGSKPARIEKRISFAKKSIRPRVPVKITQGADKTLVISLPESDITKSVQVMLARYENEHETYISRGENRGRKLKNYNVVRDIYKISKWNGKQLDIDVPASALTHEAREAGGYVVFLQPPNFGQILGVAELKVAENF